MAKCPVCETPVSEAGVLIAPWTWSKQVDAFREKLANERRKEFEPADIDAVPIADAVTATLAAHGGFIATCEGIKDGVVCGASFLVRVNDPAEIVVP